MRRKYLKLQKKKCISVEKLSASADEIQDPYMLILGSCDRAS
jgi:hypothetical protein